jgi:serine/threonine-protein kinase
MGYTAVSTVLLSPGDRIDRYEILALLGSGGMGEVYRAYDSKLERAVAIKILRVDREEGAGSGGGGTGRLLREARAAAALQHPNVLAVYDVGEVETQGAPQRLAYIAMELVVGASLRTFVGDASVPMTRRIGWLRDVALALQAAHEAGIVHRDVKPENVMVRIDGVVKVLDFGIARKVAPVEVLSSTAAHSLDTLDGPAASSLPTITREGAVVGTPMYMAPEQLRGEPVDARADQFAWGVTAYALLVGRLPWSAAHPIAMLSQILSTDPPSPNDVASSVPPGVSEVVMRTLAKVREARFASMRDVLEALDAAVAGGRPPSQPPAAVVPPPLEPAKASKRRGLALAGALVVASTAGVLVWSAAQRGPHAASPVKAATATPLSNRCRSHAECSASHGGEPYACRKSDGACVPIASEDCVPAFAAADVTRDDTVWIGAALPAKGSNAEDGAMNAAGIEFARREISGATASLTAPGASRHVPPIAVVTCDDATDAERAVHHLVDDVGVPAVIGFGSGQKLAALAGAFLIPRRVLSIATMSTNPIVTHVPQPDDLPHMVWRTSYSRTDVAAAIAGFVRDVLEPRLPASSRPTRMTLARIDQPAGALFGDELHRRAVFNGKSAVDNGNAYAEVLIPATLPDPPALQALADRIVATRPSFVVLTDDTAVMAPLVAQIEARWRGSQRPTYLLSDDSTESLAPMIGASAERRRRVFAVTPPSNEAPTARFVLRYNEAHPDAPVTGYVNPAGSYDAVYLLAYAAFSLGTAAVDGPSLGRAFARLVPPGDPLEVGPNGVFDGISALASGRSLDLRGASSALDFDLATGEARVDFALVCPDVDARGRASGDRESGIFYRTAQGTVDGTLRCP